MPVVSGTRLRIRAVRFLPAFFWKTWRAVRQLERANGFLCGRLIPERGWVFWTVTVWTGEDAMKAYRNSGAHKHAMKKVATWCDEVVTATWHVESAEMPSAAEIAGQLATTGRFLALPHASRRHTAREVPVPSGSGSRELKPRASDHGST